jgi:hypothetical protein
MATTWNFFSKLQDTASVGNEDFLTSCLATLLAGIPELQREFLEWLDPEVKIDLVSKAWDIYGQKSYSSSEYGESRLDMVFVSGDVELWFEHKWGASEGVSVSKTNPQETIRQLDKYLVAPRLQEDGRDAQVLLFYITADGNPLERARFEGQIHDSPERGGLVWNSKRNGSFRWADFFPRVRSVLSGLQSEGRPSGFRTQLLESFVTWWATQEGLVITAACDELHPENHRDREGLLQPACDWLARRIAGRWNDARESPNVGGGTEIVVYTGRKDVLRIGAWPRRPARIKGWNPLDDGKHIFRMTFQFGPEFANYLVPRKNYKFDDDRVLMAETDERGGKLYLNIYVQLLDWETEKTSEGRKQAIVTATQCGLYLFEYITNIDLTKPFQGEPFTVVPEEV